MPEDWANGRPRRERGREGLLRLGLGDGSSQEYVWDAQTSTGAVPGRCLLLLALCTPLARLGGSLGFSVGAPFLDGLPRVVLGAEPAPLADDRWQVGGGLLPPGDGSLYAARLMPATCRAPSRRASASPAVATLPAGSVNIQREDVVEGMGV